jgi:hypothetical protein
VSANSRRSQGNFRFAAAALLPPNALFYPGSYQTGAGREFTIGLETAGVLRDVLAASTWDPARAQERLRTSRGGYARDAGWQYVGLDLSTAPNKQISVGAAIEQFTGSAFGSSGTMTAAAVITSVSHDIPVRHAGYSGLILPILEDDVSHSGGLRVGSRSTLF